MQEVTAQIERKLQYAAGGTLPMVVQNYLPEIVRIAGELALEFGCQRSEVSLVFPSHNEEVIIGDTFHDCQDGIIRARGIRQRVDIVVSPALCRVGDGRMDLVTRKVIVKGQIFPYEM